MGTNVEVKKVDSQGRLVLPSDWREGHMKEGNEVYVIKYQGYLKVVPKRKVDLSKFFDTADLDVGAINDWQSLEKKYAEKEKKLH